MVEVAGGRARLRGLERPFEERSREQLPGALGRWLADQRFDVVGVDFCLGLAEADARRLGVHGLHPREIGARLGSADELYRRTHEPGGGGERKRETDVLHRSPFAPTNLRMFRQTYWGLRALDGLPASVAVPPWDPVEGRALVEVLPRHVVERIAPGCRYKGRAAEARAERERLLAATRARFALALDPAAEAALLADPEADGLDAVLAALAALAARDAGFPAPASPVARNEGWIYSIP